MRDDPEEHAGQRSMRADREERAGQQRPQAKLRDVAREAGVSVGTASNAFNRPDTVSDDARRRVAEAAAALGYGGPDPAARRLRTGRSGAIGVVFTDSLSFAFEDLA